MTKPASLDTRIAKALNANGKAADRDLLVALNNEAADEIDALRATIAAEEGRLLDITNETPDKSQEVIASARLRVERLTKVILEELHPRIEAFDRTACAVERAGREAASGVR